MNKNKGFTLIELLVVIAIIGFIASLILVSTSKARSRARDTAKVLNLRQLGKATELYYAENNIWPIFPSDNFVNGVYHSLRDGVPQWQTHLGAALTPYLSKMPVSNDPNAVTQMQYISTAAGDCCFYVENKSTCKAMRLMDAYWYAVGLENPGYISSNDGGVTDTKYEIFGGDMKYYNPCTQPRP